MFYNEDEIHITENHGEFQLAGGTRFHLYRWTPSDRKPLGRLLVLHGMAEHGARYEDFARNLVFKGFEVWLPDLPGHGKTDPAGTTGRGTFGELGAWEKLLDDLVQLYGEIPGDVPRFLMGHSMGSVLARGLFARNLPGLKGAVFMGSPGNPGLKGSVGAWWAARIARKKGPDFVSDSIAELALAPLKKPFAPNRTPYDWLNRDQQAVDAYMADEDCGFSLSVSFYHDLAKNLAALYKRPYLDRLPAEVPVYLLSGQMDPVTLFAKSTRELKEILVGSGIKKVDMKIYPDCRHELTQEHNRREVFNDIAQWMEKNLKDSQDEPRFPGF